SSCCGSRLRRDLEFNLCRLQHWIVVAIEDERRGIDCIRPRYWNSRRMQEEAESSRRTCMYGKRRGFAAPARAENCLVLAGDGYIVRGNRDLRAELHGTLRYARGAEQVKRRLAATFGRNRKRLPGGDARGNAQISGLSKARV